MTSPGSAPHEEPPPVHVKSSSTAPAGFYEVEAAGLAWLAAAPGGVPAVDVLGVAPGRISVRRLASVPPTPAAADELGRGLARTHAAGAPWWGCPPQGWDGDGFIGPLPMPHAARDRPSSFGAFYARYRLEPFLRRARDAGALGATEAAAVDRLVTRIADGDELVGPPEPVSRLHGDLWSGNVLWTPAGAVLIDPAAHGGHRETDLAMLALFGAPMLDRVLSAYALEAQHLGRPLADGWRDRVGVHQLHPLLVHVVLFGGGFVGQVLDVVRRWS